MPSKSRKQQRLLYATKGAAWVKAHGFDKLKKGGKHGSKRKKTKKRKK